MIRFFDLIFSLIGLIILSPIMLIIFILGYFDTGSPILVQERVGKNKIPFNIYKFRSMYIDTKSVATHLVDCDSVTKYGSFLRKTKLDELPQLLNVFKGEMSLVGPRPSLYNQEELIREREKRGVCKIAPGNTGLAQIKKIDMSTPMILAETDAEMIANWGVKVYFKYIFLTLFGNGF